MLARSIFLTGCNRGIGLELTRQFAPKAEQIIATCRNPDLAGVL